MGSDEEGKQSFNKGSIGKHKHKNNQGQHYKECRGGRHTWYFGNKSWGYPSTSQGYKEIGLLLLLS